MPGLGGHFNSMTYSMSSRINKVILNEDDISLWESLFRYWMQKNLECTIRTGSNTLKLEKCSITEEVHCQKITRLYYLTKQIPFDEKHNTVVAITYKWARPSNQGENYLILYLAICECTPFAKWFGDCIGTFTCTSKMTKKYDGNEFVKLWCSLYAI